MEWPSFEDQLAAGRALRKKVPRAAHARWHPAGKGRDVVAMLEASNRGRVPHLVPIRYGRMRRSPYAFLRGAASIMAFDIAPTPATGIQVQACGDAHVLNFGGFATPERRLVFDVNDFDETLPAPWEWDVKRLAASVAVAARSLAIGKAGGVKLTKAAVGAYRDAMAGYASMGVLARWHQRIDARDVPGLGFTRSRQASARPGIEQQFPRCTEAAGLERRMKDALPLLYHPPRGDKSMDHVRYFLAHYRRSLLEDRRLLLDRYRLVDVVTRVAGVGSVGRRCLVALLMAGNDDALFLQLKEARASALEPYAGSSRHPNHGQRVIEGQRLMQAASDIFLGWSPIPALRAHFYVRQLRDHKIKPRLADLSAAQLEAYVAFCGRALARAHAKVGSAATISGYLGKRDTFDAALATFAQRYADQTERDHAALKRAAQAGRVPVEDA